MKKLSTAQKVGAGVGILALGFIGYKFFAGGKNLNPQEMLQALKSKVWVNAISGGNNLVNFISSVTPEGKITHTTGDWIGTLEAPNLISWTNLTDGRVVKWRSTN